MRREYLKILILCSSAEILDLLAKAIYSKYPSSRLFFAQKIGAAFTKFEQHHHDILILIPKEPVWDAAIISSMFLSLDRNCSILLISHSSSGKSISECIQLGVKDILNPPINEEHFLCKLAAIILLHTQRAL